jgi:chemotaxis protein histidine kinase CheA
MDAEKQKQITGYFIDESMEHLQTIETGLLNVETMMTDSETLNEVFRAAHSIKGGAAMLGFSSIQYTAHKLEDYFKILKDNSEIKVDQNLQSLFLAGFDSLKDLLEQLQSPLGLPQDVANNLMEKSKQVFERLKEQLDQTIGHGNVAESPASGEVRAMLMVFQNDIPQRLREMLELFKQADHPTSRQHLQAICDQMYRTGEQFELRYWCDLIKAVKSAIGNQNNQFRSLAPVVIKEVKQAQEMVLAQRGSAIAISNQLRQILPISEPVTSLQIDDDQSSVFGISPSALANGWHQFGDHLGWRSMGSWIRSSGISYQVSAPAGHLPAPIWLASWDQAKDSNADQFRAEYDAMLKRLGDCNL